MKSWDFSTLWLCTSLILWGTEYRSYSVEKCAVTVSFSHLIPGRMVICALRISNFGLLLFRPQVEQQNRAWEAANVTLRYGKNVRNIPSTCFTRPAVFKANHIVTKVSIPIYPLQRVFYPQNLACTPKNDEVPYMLLYIEGTKIRNKTKCTPNFKLQWEPWKVDVPNSLLTMQSGLLAHLRSNLLLVKWCSYWCFQFDK